MKQKFDEMIGTPPPSTVDIRGVVHRQRCVIAWQRIAGVTAVVAMIAGIGFVLIGGRGGSDSFQPADAPSASRTVNAAQFDRYWQAATETVVPRAQWWGLAGGNTTARPDAWDQTRDGKAPHLALMLPDGTAGPIVISGGRTEGQVKVDGVVGVLDFSVVERTPSLSSPPGAPVAPLPSTSGTVEYRIESDCWPGADGAIACTADPRCELFNICEERTGPAGQRILIQTREANHLWVWVVTKDGKVAAQMSVDGVDNGPMPLTVEQIIAILTAPGLAG